MGDNRTYAVRSEEAWAFILGLPMGYLFFGVPAAALMGWLGKNMSLVSQAYDSAGTGIASLSVGVIITGLLIWKFGHYLIPALKGIFGGMLVRGLVQVVRTVMGYGPDPYTNGWLYRIAVEHGTMIYREVAVSAVSCVIQHAEAIICT